MLELLVWLEDSPVSELVRTSGPYTYGIVNLFHVFGIALLFGAIVLLDLRLLGVWRTIPVMSLARPVVPVAATGLVLAILTGAVLFCIQATEYYYNPFLYLKLGALALGIVNITVLHSSAAWKAVERAGASTKGRVQLAAAGAVSLACWISVITAGRMIAYW